MCSWKTKRKNKKKKKEEINKKKNLWKQYSLKMLDVFRGLKTLIKKSSVTIDSSIFRLHYSISGTDFVFLQFFDQSSQIFPHMREIAKYSAVAYFLDSLIANGKIFKKDILSYQRQSSVPQERLQLNMHSE